MRSPGASHHATQLIAFPDRSGNLSSALTPGPVNDRFSRTIVMSESAGCFNFLRGRRSLNKKGEVVIPVQAQQPPRHHGGGEVVSNLLFPRVVTKLFTLASGSLLFEQL
jgi:hypothetical protein